jgi:hypothetical protein
VRKFAFVVLLALVGSVGGRAPGQAPAPESKPKPASEVKPSPEVLPMPRLDGEEPPAALDGNPKPNPDDEEPPAGPDPVSKASLTTMTPGCPCPCPVPCPPPCPCGGTGDVVNIKAASQVTGKLQIQGSGSYAVGANRKLQEVDLVAINTTTLIKYTLKATPGASDWSCPNLSVPAGTYNVSAQIITTNKCGGDAKTTASDPKQTIKGVIVK